MRLGHDEQGGGGRKRQEQREFDRTVLQVRGLLQIARLQSPRQFGKQNDRDSNADHAQRELIDPVRIGERRNRGVLTGRDRRADQLVDLGDAAGNGRRQGKA